MFKYISVKNNMIKQLIAALAASLVFVNIGTVYGQKNQPKAQITILIRELEGLVYIDLPENVCSLLQATNSITVCLRGRSAFFILDRTVDITSNGKPISQIIKIEELPQHLAAG